MSFLGITLITLYTLASAFILAYSVSQAILLFYYLKRKKKNGTTQPGIDFEYDKVLIQLPVYNEKLVITRLIESVCAIDYPKNKLIIQVLDDSTDDTSEIIHELVKEKQARGFIIHHITRESRSEYKAGALKYGLTLCDAPFVAIFDADFIPPPDFLKKILAYFRDTQTGMVQTRWTHINKNFSLLTRLQAFALDAHFIVEQNGRNESGSYINFNGTAGVWRRACILDAGNWQGDTLTEDLDLSYRAQMKGWKFVYTDEIPVPAELPPTLSALKSQQYRWTKGGAECARKHLGQMLLGPFSLMQKIQGTFHLLNTFTFLCIVLSAISSVALLQLKIHHYISGWFFQIAQVMFISFALIGGVYYFSMFHEKSRTLKSIISFFYTYPLFLSVSMALAFHNSMALIEGYIGRKTPFVRTPKYNINNQPVIQVNSYHFQVPTLWLALEIMMFGYFLFAIISGIYYMEYGLIAYHSMLATGFAILIYYSLPFAVFSTPPTFASVSEQVNI